MRPVEEYIDRDWIESLIDSDNDDAVKHSIKKLSVLMKAYAKDAIDEQLKASGKELKRAPKWASVEWYLENTNRIELP